MKQVTRTAWGAGVQNHLYLGLPYQRVKHTTLNEKLDILADEDPTVTEYPKLGYFCIGAGGHRVEMINGMPAIVPEQHSAVDAAPFSMIPLIMREPNNDISPTKRASYILRKEINVNGTTYIAYYGRRLDTSKMKIRYELVQIVDGKETVTPYVPDSSNLNPKPKPISPNGVVVLDAEHVRVTTDISIIFDSSDTAELRNVANLLFNNEYLAIVSEIALCSGVDRDITLNDPNQGKFTFKEAISVQCCHFNATYHSAITSNEGFTIGLSVGSGEPLLTLEESNK